MTKKLLITLAPADYYFFGGENTFDTETVPGVRNYLVRSNRLPQQTALVGLLRHILFNNAYDIGAESFNPDYRDEQVQDFGALQNISPLFLQHDEGSARRFLLHASKLWLENKQEITVRFDNPLRKGFTGDDFLEAPALEIMKNGKPESYTAKEHTGDFWGFLDKKEVVPAKDIFISSLHIGIDKMSRMKPRKPRSEENANPDEDAFYKQEYFRLTKGYRFALVAEFELKSDEPDFGGIFNITMPFGGENRTFLVRAEEWTDALQQKFQPGLAYGNHSDRIVLTSDACVESPRQLLDLCSFSIVNAKPFRSFQTPQEVYGTDVKAKNRALSNLHHYKNKTLMHLLERGSVFFPKKGHDKDGKAYSQKVVEMLNQTRNFQNIGYNHFHTHNHPFSL